MADRTSTIVVMGVSGSGKSTVARAVAELLDAPFVEGDDLHPPANVAKMRAGQPLDDADRWPWLDEVAQVIAGSTQDLVLTCSALKKAYRDRLRQAGPTVGFALLYVPADVLRERLRHRTGHYMPATLLDSQLATLEQLGPGEHGVTVAGSGDPLDAAQRIVEALT